MPWTSGESWPETSTGLLKMRLHYVKEGKVSGFPNAHIRCIIRPSLEGSVFWAMNTIKPAQVTEAEAARLHQTSRLVRYSATVAANPELIQQPRALRKEVFAKEFLEVITGLHDIEYRERAKLLSANRDAMTAVISEGDRPLWEDSRDKIRELKRGLESLLLSPESILRYLTRELGMDGESFVDAASKGGGLIRSTADGLADHYHIRNDLAKDRLLEFMFQGS